MRLEGLGDDSDVSFGDVFSTAVDDLTKLAPVGIAAYQVSQGGQPRPQVTYVQQPAQQPAPAPAPAPFNPPTIQQMAQPAPAPSSGGLTSLLVGALVVGGGAVAYFVVPRKRGVSRNPGKKAKKAGRGR